MTNKEIIFNKKQELLEKGILKETGRILSFELPTGEKIQVKETEEIHTFQGWKECGYSVKKGEKSQIRFAIWKCVKRKKKDENEEDGQTSMFLADACWFKKSQVEKI